MDPQRMLDKCRKQQWKLEDLDWTQAPRAMGRAEEMAVVQYFTDMAAIERFAGALFEEQRRIVRDPTLKKIFATFVADEERHARVAERLAAHYDVHHYKTYRVSEGLEKFRPHFLRAIRHLSAEVANAYITVGELILDVALLRSINDYVHDPMSESAMELINRDESRHIAVDYHMAEFYASDAYQSWLAEQPSKRLRERLKAWWTFAAVLYHGGPFAQQVFFEPMAVVDPSGRRLREAVKRMQLLGMRPEVADRPFSRFMRAMRDIHNHPKLGAVLGGLARRVTANFPQELYRDLADPDEMRRAQRVSMDELAQEALQAKFAH